MTRKEFRNTIETMVKSDEHHAVLSKVKRMAEAQT